MKSLDLDSCTLSEILRLHILASGADVTSANAKYRYQKRGGFDATDDACMELRLSNPSLLKKLSSTSVYDLTPGKLQIAFYSLPTSCLPVCLMPRKMKWLMKSSSKSVFKLVKGWLVCLFEGVTETERSFVCWFAPQMATAAGAASGLSQEPRTPPRFLTSVAEA